MSLSSILSRAPRPAVAAVAAASAAALVVGITAAAGAATASHQRSFSFRLVPAAGIKACIPHARGNVTITTGELNDTMKVTLHGMPKNTGYDLFVIQQPNKPFGISWYQSDVNVGRKGNGSATVKGIFDSETFSVSPGTNPTFAPTHQFHLGLWFNNPKTPFNLGCEPGATTPTVTPFNGEQHAGIQALTPRSSTARARCPACTADADALLSKRRAPAGRSAPAVPLLLVTSCPSVR
jgi:hypothetical protein